MRACRSSNCIGAYIQYNCAGLRAWMPGGSASPTGRTPHDVQGFVRGAYAAAIGTILGACILLGRIAIGD